jgi:hypothetical protein
MNKQYGRCKQVTNCRRVSKRKQARGNKIWQEYLMKLRVWSCYTWTTVGLQLMMLNERPLLRQMRVKSKGRAIPVTGRGGPRLWDVKAPTFSRQSAHRWQWSCQPHAKATLYPQEDSWYKYDEVYAASIYARFTFVPLIEDGSNGFTASRG